MKTKIKQVDNETNFSKYEKSELAEAFVFSIDAPLSQEAQADQENFWKQRRKQFENRTTEQKIYHSLLQLKFQMEEYVNTDAFNPSFNFGHFLNEYVNRQQKKDKQFAEELDIKPAVLSQYLNNHRPPTERFIIRLELHSNALIPAIVWFKLLQKNKEYEISTDCAIRISESKHVKNRLQFVL